MKYDLSVGYIPGRENTITDILSRWAYPASQAAKYVSRHGTEEERQEMREIIRQEREQERGCLWILIGQAPTETHTTTVAPVEGIPEGDSNPPPRRSPRHNPQVHQPQRVMHPGSQTRTQPKQPETDGRHEVEGRGQLPAQERQTSPRSNTGDKKKRGSAESQATGSPGGGQAGEAAGLASPTPQSPADHMPQDTQERTEHQDSEPVLNSPNAEKMESEEEEEEEGPVQSDDIPGVPEFHVPAALVADWDHFYRQCPRWGTMWVATHTPGDEWPNGVHLHAGRMFTDNRLCIPMGLDRLWVRHAHAQLGHAVFKRLWDQLELQYAWGNAMRQRSMLSGWHVSVRCAKLAGDLKRSRHLWCIPPCLKELCRVSHWIFSTCPA